MSNFTYSPSHREGGTPIINIQSNFRTDPDFCTNVSLVVLFGSDGNTHTHTHTHTHSLSKQSDMCIYTRILHNTETQVGQNKYKRAETAVKTSCHIGYAFHSFASSSLGPCVCVHPSLHLRPASCRSSSF
jgi:hypothetical protein